MNFIDNNVNMRALKLAFTFIAVLLSTAGNANTLNVGSKRFTESYVLAEIIQQRAARVGEAKVTHLQGLGNTAIVLGALQSGAITIYPEYTGTIAREILKLDTVPSLAVLNEKLAPMGLAASVPLGFNNTYALAIPSVMAKAKNIKTLSDLASHANLRLGLSQEFIGRADGWAGLKRTYDLPWSTVRGLDHGIAYQAIKLGQIDVIDVYSTDAKISEYQLTVLADDKNYFPRYDAVLLHKVDLAARYPAIWNSLQQLTNQIDEAAMRGMNVEAEINKLPFDKIASTFLANKFGGNSANVASLTERPFLSALFAPDFARLAWQHFVLVFLSLAASTLVGIPLGVVAARSPRIGGVIIGVTNILQTIPSLALLAILISLTGQIGITPALIALSIYALLPIVRNTHIALTQIPAGTIAAAHSLGMTPSMVLRHIELPLARTTIVAGIKTSAVMNVGTATIAAFIGAGGFGERIVTGLALNDNLTLLAGALPVAVMAIAIDAAFTLGERLATPLGLRIKR
jgi:osmoprotectant transport system permease protein